MSCCSGREEGGVCSEWLPAQNEAWPAILAGAAREAWALVVGSLHTVQACMFLPEAKHPGITLVRSMLVSGRNVSWWWVHCSGRVPVPLHVTEGTLFPVFLEVSGLRLGKLPRLDAVSQCAASQRGHHVDLYMLTAAHPCQGCCAWKRRGLQGAHVLFEERCASERVLGAMQHCGPTPHAYQHVCCWQARLPYVPCDSGTCTMW